MTAPDPSPAIMPSDPHTILVLDAQIRDWFERLTPGQRMTVYLAAERLPQRSEAPR
jgi:hypothetical protein